MGEEADYLDDAGEYYAYKDFQEREYRARSNAKNGALNLHEQEYKGIKIRLIKRQYKGYEAKRYTLNGTNQNVWIPNKHLTDDGTIKPGEDIDYVFRKAQRQLELAGYTGAIPGIKRISSNEEKS